MLKSDILDQVKKIVNSDRPSFDSVLKAASKLDLPIADLGYHDLDYKYLEKYLKHSFKDHNPLYESEGGTSVGNTLKSLISFSKMHINIYDLFRELQLHGLTASAIEHISRVDLVSFEYVEIIDKAIEKLGVLPSQFVECGVFSRPIVNRIKDEISGKPIVEILEYSFNNSSRFELNNEYTFDKKYDEVIVYSAQKESAKEIYKRSFNHLESNDCHRLGIFNELLSHSNESFISYIGKRSIEGNSQDEFRFKLLH